MVLSFGEHVVLCDPKLKLQVCTALFQVQLADRTHSGRSLISHLPRDAQKIGVNLKNADMFRLTAFLIKQEGISSFERHTT